MAEVLVVAVLTVLCFAAGLTGGRRIAASAMAPVILLLLSIIGNHSDIASVPPGTAYFTTFGWVAGVFVFMFTTKSRSEAPGTHSGRVDKSASVDGSASPTPR